MTYGFSEFNIDAIPSNTEIVRRAQIIFKMEHLLDDNYLSKVLCLYTLFCQVYLM